jgi:hypothetical protein
MGMIVNATGMLLIDVGINAPVMRRRDAEELADIMDAVRFVLTALAVSGNGLAIESCQRHGVEFDGEPGEVRALRFRLANHVRPCRVPGENPD